jgi:C_GCAxxG_C_C family probable redox protein
VLLATMEQLGVEGYWLPLVASGFGGGIGRTGLVCGAIAGAVIAGGTRFGTGSPGADRDKRYEFAGSLVNSFIEEFGSTNCRELIEVDLLDPAEIKRALAEGIFASKCAAYVEFCANKVGRLGSGLET